MLGGRKTWHGDSAFRCQDQKHPVKKLSPTIIMILSKRRNSSHLSSLLSSTMLILKTSILLLILFSELTLAEKDFAFFNSTSLITITDTTWDLSTTMEITFRTCSGSGNLISMNGSLNSTSSASSSNSQELALLLQNSSVVFIWSVNGSNGTVYAGSNINNNTWYTVTLKYLLNSVQFSVSQGSVASIVVVANRTHNSFLKDVRLSGNLKIGDGFSGCLYQGLGVNFTASGSFTRNITWDQCPLTTSNGCTNVGPDSAYCYLVPCQHGATCVDGLNNYTCFCPYNFNGTNCENDLAEMYGCAVQPCINNGTCLHEPGTSSSKFRCLCAEGYTGEICETPIDLCLTNPCRENGTCIRGINSYRCNCTGTGFTGQNCTEDIDECLNATACGSFPCSNRPGGFTCNCPPGFDGPSCKELNECSSSPCLNGANCTDKINAFNCTCVPGYTGTTCDTYINMCDSGPCTLPKVKCIDSLNNYSCVCMDGYSGDQCEDINECALNVCENNVSCTNSPGSYNCTCLPGFTGKNCSVAIKACEPNPCLNNATCSDRRSDYNCSCLPGFTGQNCEKDIDECASHQCQNQGTCLDQVNGYICVCQPGWTGLHCEEDINECLSNPCLQGGQCHNYLNFYNCTCPTGFEGQNCGININDCNRTEQVCEHGGVCLDGVNDYFCNCTSEWMGKNCSEKYNACAFEPCLNGANCTTQEPYHNYTCACLSGFTGQNCETNIDDCIIGVGACQTYQVCYDGINNFTCGCQRGYTGDRCETEINECEDNPCQNNGTCINGHGNYTCTCLSRYIDLRPLVPNGLFLTGYNGTDCENDINECDYINPPICQANGLCTNSPGSFKCYCEAGEGQFHTGTLCEQLRSYCDIRPPSDACQNGGTCVNILLGYKCNCAPGFTGNFCETDINECESSPCQYNGTCDDRVNGYVCTCIDGITGDNCETNIDDCEPNPCLNGGDCQDRINSFLCDCSDTGFNGTVCENNKDDCVGDTCQNGGTCVDGVKAYTCECLPGYSGSKCDFDIPECSPNPCAYNSICLENSNQSLYDKDDPHFVNFTYEKAAGYFCVCVPGVTGVHCSEDIPECLSDPCQNNATCEEIFKDGFSCNCLKGYEGHLCETEINECNVYRPCKNGGSCTDRVADYDCTCPTPIPSRQNYAGKNCTTYLSGCDGPRRCRNGNCIPKLISEVQNLHSFQCDCYQGYTGSFCSETTDISFRGNLNGFIWNQMNTSEFDLSLHFQTTVSNAVLVLWKLSANTYVSVELNNGMVVLKYKSYSNVRSCTLDTLTTVNNSAYHQLHLIVTHNVTLVLPGDRCRNTGCSTQNCQTSLAFSGDQPPPISQMYIGSISMAGVENETFPASFVGCMEDVKIDNDLYYPGRQIGQYVRVNPGCSRTQQCVKDSCNGHGFCEDLWDSYTCICYRPFYGVKCENEYQSATFGTYEGTYVTYGYIPGAVDNWVFSFFIITRQDNGFLLYFGTVKTEVPGRLAFVGLYIKNGNLSGDFYKCGYTNHFDTARKISDGQKHFVSLDIKNTTFKVMLNSEIVFQDDGMPAKSCSPYGFLIDVVNLGQGGIISSSRQKRDVEWPQEEVEDLEEIFTINHQRWKRQVANSSSLLSSYASMPGFQGVIQDVEVNNFLLSFNDSSFTLPISLNVTIGANSTRNVCEDNLCENGGICTDIFYNDFNCTCPRGFMGKNCSLPDYCSFATCPSESECRNLQEGYECISTAAFTTDSSLVTYIITGDTPEPILTFDFRTRGLYGLIFLLRQGDYYFKVRVASGRLEMNWKLTSDFSLTKRTILNRLVNDGQWYQSRFEVNETNIKLQVLQDSVLIDETDFVHLAVANFSFENMLRNGEIVLGNIDRGRFTSQWEAGYNGCLREVRMGGQLMPFFTDDAFKNNIAKNRFLAQRVENIVNNCAGRDACAGQFCLNGGTCADLWNDYKCECQSGFEGQLCEVNPDNCASQPCFNGGVCVDGLATFTCTCPKGFSGDLCDTELDPCKANNLCANNSTCVNSSGDFSCYCTDPEYTGWYCNVTTHQNCSNSGLCQNNGTCSNINITIGTITNVSSFNCSCRPGYKGPLCEKAIDYCSINGPMCANNGQCINHPESQSFECKCNETLDYRGTNCSEKIDNCPDNICNNGTCVDGVGNFTCWCQDAYSGSRCESVIDGCQNKSLCQHANCSGGVCNCTGSGWTGDGCDVQVNECNSTEPVCLHDGNCTDLEGSYNCSCTQGYNGSQCQNPVCSKDICQNGGTCHTNVTDWYCLCPPYVQGQTCDAVGPCYYQPCDQDHTSNCTQSIEFSNYTCGCKTGWSGVNCTDDVDECAAEDSNKHKCVNGNCLNTNGSYLCVCQPGYTGRFCDTDINECDPNPCQNGGICTDKVNNYTCNCNGTGYTGPTCSENIDECVIDTTICNHGNCLDRPGSYDCDCGDRYLGSHCESDNPCYNNTMCLNDGKCQYNLTQDGHYAAQCDCSVKYEGVTCEKSRSSGSKSQDLGVIIGPIVGGVVLVILVIVIIAFVMTARSKRATRGAYSPSQQETSGSRVEMGNVLKKPPEERLI